MTARIDDQDIYQHYNINKSNSSKKNVFDDKFYTVELEDQIEKKTSIFNYKLK